MGLLAGSIHAPIKKSTCASDDQTKRTYPKPHVNYWKARLEHRTHTRDGKTHEVPEWSVRIHLGAIARAST